jgi:hypothetical protein
MAGGSMHRNVVAAALQVVAVLVILAGAFAVDAKVGVIAVGFLLLMVGLDLEDDA